MATSTPSTGLSGYIFECCCGERFNNVAAASVCKKCRTYSVWGYTKYVVNIETDEVVHGELPTDEEYAEAEAQYQIRLEEERKEFEDMKAAWDREQQWLEDVARRGAEQAAKQAAEQEADRLSELQDRMMGY